MYKLDIPEPLVEVESEGDGYSQVLVLKPEIREWLDTHVGIYGEDWNWQFKNNRDHIFLTSDRVLYRTEIIFNNPDHAVLFKLTWGGNI